MSNSRPPTASGKENRRGTPWHAIVPIVTAAAGLMFATSATTAAGTNLRGTDTGSLAEVIRERTQAVQQQARRVQALQGDVDAVAAAHPSDEQALRSLSAARASIAARAGLAPVNGPGLSVTLNDARRSGPLPAGVSVDDVVVHQQDVQAVVNALWAGGAEAMTIQDQRVISTSAVRCVGNTLILQGRVYAPPYRIAAIGDVSTMKASLERDPAVATYRQYVDSVGLGYEVSSLGAVSFPAYEGSWDVHYASAGGAGSGGAGGEAASDTLTGTVR